MANSETPMANETQHMVVILCNVLLDVDEQISFFTSEFVNVRKSAKENEYIASKYKGSLLTTVLRLCKCTPNQVSSFA